MQKGVEGLTASKPGLKPTQDRGIDKLRQQMPKGTGLCFWRHAQGARVP